MIILELIMKTMYTINKTKKKQKQKQENLKAYLFQG